MCIDMLAVHARTSLCHFELRVGSFILMHPALSVKASSIHFIYFSPCFSAIPSLQTSTVEDTLDEIHVACSSLYSSHILTETIAGSELSLSLPNTKIKLLHSASGLPIVPEVRPSLHVFCSSCSHALRSVPAL